MLFSGLLVSQDQTADDILFLKIQELEEEIAFLRSELESQAYLLEKLQNEDLENAEQSSSNDNDSQAFRFEGINDDETIDELYQKGINSLNLNELDAAEEAFSKLVENYSEYKSSDIVKRILLDLQYEVEIQPNRAFMAEFIAKKKNKKYAVKVYGAEKQ